MKTAAVVLLGVLLALTRPALAQNIDGPNVTGALLRGLDKITARVTTFMVPLAEEVSFGTLRITVQTCRKRPPEETPEVAVFLEIDEERHGEDGRLALFSGWMFASSPALLALEHPVYDGWGIDCSTDDVDSDLPESLKSANPDNSPDNSPDSASDRRE